MSMLEEDCPRCSANASTHIGRRDIGVIERHMYICSECGLIFGITDPKEWRNKRQQLNS